ncbi:MAG: hypothetical protein WDN30_00775 [Pararobbsia sp.]
MRNWVNGPPLNYAAGIEIGAHAVRVVVLGYGRSTRHTAPWLRLLHAGGGRIEASATSGADILEPRAIASALVDAFGGPDEIQRWGGAQTSVGLPPSTVLTRTVALAQLAGRRASRLTCLSPVPCSGGESSTLDQFEEGVLAEAERMMALDRSELCVDWFRAPSSCDVEQATIVATTRQQVETRVTCAALAGLRIHAVDGDADAALRACRYWGHVRHPASQAGIAIWAVAGETRAWCLRHRTVEHTLNGTDGIDTDFLRVWAQRTRPAMLVIGGEPACSRGGGLDAEQLGGMLGCAVEAFEPGLCCPPLEPVREHRAGPEYAVAFGLALRGVE